MPGNWGFCGPTYVSPSPNVDDEDAMNCYCEQSGSPNAKTPIALLHTPGRRIFAAIEGENSMPCLFTVNGRTFAAASHLYEVNAGGQVIANYGSLGLAPAAGSLPMMTANQTQLVILNNGALFVLVFLGAITAAGIHAGAAGTGYAPGDTGVINGTGATYTVLTVGGGGAVATFRFTPGSGNAIANNVATTVLTGGGDGAFAVDITAVGNNVLYSVVAGQFQGLIAQIGFVDGYVIATIQNSHTFQVSNLEDASVWNGLNVATLSYFPDNIVSMSCYARVIKFSSAKKSVWYYNGGAGFPVFIPIQGAYFETGSCATFADSVSFNNTAFWLSQDERGSLVAMLSNGFSGQRISTHAVEFAWQQYKVTSDAISWSYEEYGHQFIVVDFPTAQASWAYDLLTEYWHKRGFWVRANGTYIMDRAISHTLNFGMHLVGDWASGTIYQLSSQFCTDFGNAIRGYRRSPTLSIDNKWIYFPQLELDVELGLGVSALDAQLWEQVQGAPPLTDGDGNPRPAQVMLRWSNDAGNTWSNTYPLDLPTGNYRLRVIKRMLGRARKRIWEVSWSDPIPWRFADAYVEAEPQAR